MTTKELREIAERATPGDWKYVPGDSWCSYSHVSCGNKTLVFENHDGHAPGECGKTSECGFPDDGQDAEFIAAMNPTTAIKLLSDYEKMREALEECEVTINHALELGHLGAGSTKGMAKRTLTHARECLAGLQIGKGEG